MWCPKILFSRNLYKGLILCPAKNEEIYGIFPYQKFFISCYITFKKKTSICGLQVGHIRIVLWVSGSNGSTGVTHFQPCGIIMLNDTRLIDKSTDLNNSLCS